MNKKMNIEKKTKCNKFNLFTIVLIASMQIILVVVNLLQTTHIPSHEYEVAIATLFLPMIIALLNVLLLNESNYRSILQLLGKWQGKLLRLLSHKLLRILDYPRKMFPRRL